MQNDKLIRLSKLNKANLAQTLSMQAQIEALQVNPSIKSHLQLVAENTLLKAQVEKSEQTLELVMAKFRLAALVDASKESVVMRSTDADAQLIANLEMENMKLQALLLKSTDMARDLIGIL